MRADIHAQADTNTHTHPHTHRLTHGGGMKQTQSEGANKSLSSAPQRLCMIMIARACAASFSLNRVLFQYIRPGPFSQVSSDDLRPPPTTSARGQVDSSSKATAGGLRRERVTSVRLHPEERGCSGEPKPFGEVWVRGWGAGGWCRKNAQPGTGTRRRAPPERRHSRVIQSAAPSWSVPHLRVFS